ncbi:hypothetical protein BO83DRAFT_404151 [Aspergillus eucalypticola CBS 122712]|uniref:Uncharacterized protein n=1 Tax=Aspergillus eucalypticola (strain CBS 122712 / IBT 29274) TaxID=1448314 RepID=A0A317ULD6_ASPEC|nr:uncharacterized protein BO83DRAFT_404151 [Aspergillus eucalypticola CBS 122712]PWY61988.1 hypothetical protein BO83DRAFT_404151 [Aspergillus eucalypticola CBS 122712]
MSKSETTGAPTATLTALPQTHTTTLTEHEENGQFSDLISPFFDKAANGDFEKPKLRVEYVLDYSFIISKMFGFLYHAYYDDSPEILGDPAGKRDTAAEDNVLLLMGLPSTERIAQDIISWLWRQIYIVAAEYLIQTSLTTARNGSQCPPRADLRVILIRFFLRRLDTPKRYRQIDEFVYELSADLIERIVELKK